MHFEGTNIRAMAAPKKLLRLARIENAAMFRVLKRTHQIRIIAMLVRSQESLREKR